MLSLLTAALSFAFLATGCRNSREAEFFLAGEETEGSAAKENDSEEPQEEKTGGSESGDDRAQTSPVPEETEAGSAEAQTAEASGQPEPQEIYVDVCGAVARPGVYALETGSRVFQAVEKAGGFLPEAAGTYINQAQTLSDGQQIYVPTKEEAQEMSHPGQNSGNAAVSGGSSSDSPQSGEEAKVNLNTADAEALMTLSGIGEAKAEAILAYREEHGGFSSIEEIMNVSGIKESTFSKIKDKISVE